LAALSSSSEIPYLNAIASIESSFFIVYRNGVAVGAGVAGTSIFTVETVCVLVGVMVRYGVSTALTLGVAWMGNEVVWLQAERMIPRQKSKSTVLLIITDDYTQKGSSDSLLVRVIWQIL
jgi:hypothetical protein